MEATFYGILGVDPDATEETIVRAYREQTKAHHPDVSDDPDARERFKRLTRAKEVLTDEAERERYHRLGHAAYVGEYGSGADGGTVTGSASDVARQYVDRGTDADTASGAVDAARRSQTRGGRTGYGTAAEYYRPGKRVRPAQSSGVGTLLESVRRVGPWLFVHLALLGCALTAAVVLAVGGLAGDLSPVVAGVMAASMVAISFVVSATHVLTSVSG
ncbi:DnaJ domain-containing protein [Haloarcula brevis]|uniref:DnaJ domain-containing protein n=1 Tax=Haloarcula brevis TaxID=3111453 RepID=UPI00300F213D